MYKFRITFSTNVDEHYKGDGEDTTVSMVVEADTFRDAEGVAVYQLTTWLVDPKKFELVSVQRIDHLFEKDEDYGIDG